MLPELLGRTVAVGIRPEALLRDDRGLLVASFSSCERFGPDQLVHATIGGRRVRAADDGTISEPGPTAPLLVALSAAIELNVWEPLTLRVDPAALHFFDLATGASLR